MEKKKSVLRRVCAFMQILGQTETFHLLAVRLKTETPSRNNEHGYHGCASEFISARCGGEMLSHPA